MFHLSPLNIDLKCSAVLDTALDSQMCMVLQDLSTSFEDHFGVDYNTSIECVPCTCGDADATFELKTHTVRQTYSCDQPPSSLDSAFKEG